MNSMKAIQISEYGGVEVLRIHTNVSKPSPAKHQILVEVYTASINPFDWKVRAGYMKNFMPLTFPAILGGDFSGIVKEVGEDVSHLKAGDQVYGTAHIVSGGTGAFAEFTCAHAENTSRKPESVDFFEAAALPLVGSSSIQALEEHIQLKSGQKILIHGGAGGIGHVAIQVAKSRGAYVAVTVSARDKDFVKSLGADEVIDYTSEKFEEKLKNFDAVFDTVGGETTNASFKVLKGGGVLVSMLGEPDPELAKKYGVKAVGQSTKITTEHLERLRQLVDNGKLQVQIDGVFSLDDIQEAFKHLEKGHPRGKVVLSIQ